MMVRAALVLVLALTLVFAPPVLAADDYHPCEVFQSVFGEGKHQMLGPFPAEFRILDAQTLAVRWSGRTVILKNWKFEDKPGGTIYQAVDSGDWNASKGCVYTLRTRLARAR